MILGNIDFIMRYFLRKLDPAICRHMDGHFLEIYFIDFPSLPTYTLILLFLPFTCEFPHLCKVNKFKS